MQDVYVKRSFEIFKHKKLKWLTDVDMPQNSLILKLDKRLCLPRPLQWIYWEKNRMWMDLWRVLTKKFWRKRIKFFVQIFVGQRNDIFVTKSKFIGSNPRFDPKFHTSNSKCVFLIWIDQWELLWVSIVADFRFFEIFSDWINFRCQSMS